MCKGGQKINDITKIEQKRLFLLTLLVSFVLRFSRKDWFTQYLCDLILRLAYFLSNIIHFNLIILGDCAKRWPKCAYISK